MNKKSKVADLREDYVKHELNRSDLEPDAISQFEKWFAQAVDENAMAANILTLSTATKNGIPSSRIVLLKGYDSDGFVFYTNQESDKAKEMEENAHVSLLFFWPTFERQIRINGTVEKVSEEEAVEYFQSRPKESQIGAWASNQSTVLKNREELEAKVAQISAQYANENVLPKPPYWGGYRVNPSSFEFWQGRQSRLHDRFRYTKSASGWKIDRLSP